MRNPCFQSLVYSYNSLPFSSTFSERIDSLHFATQKRSPLIPWMMMTSLPYTSLWRSISFIRNQELRRSFLSTGVKCLRNLWRFDFILLFYIIVSIDTIQYDMIHVSFALILFSFSFFGFALIHFHFHLFFRYFQMIIELLWKNWKKRRWYCIYY